MEELKRRQSAKHDPPNQVPIWGVMIVILLLQGCVGTVVGTAVGATTAVVVGVVTLPFKAGAAIVKAVVPEVEKKKGEETKTKEKNKVE